MKQYIIIFLMTVSFLYGALALFSAKLFKKKLKDIQEEYKKLYARLCGVALLLTSCVVGIYYYLTTNDLIYYMVRQPFLIVIGCILLSLPLAIVIISGKALRKKPVVKDE